MGIGLVLVGGFSLYRGIRAIGSALPQRRRAQRIVATPTSSIALAPGSGPVEIKGRISPSERGLVTAPFSGRKGVWVRVIVEHEKTKGNLRTPVWSGTIGGGKRVLVDETESRPFLVDDGSGQVARVLPENATVVLDTREVASSGTFHDAGPEIDAFLSTRGIKSTNFLGFNKKMRYKEEVLSPGEDFYAIGPSRREEPSTVGAGEQVAATSQLVLFTGQDPADELIISNKAEKELVSKFRWKFALGILGATFGLLFGSLALLGGIGSLMNP